METDEVAMATGPLGVTVGTVGRPGRATSSAARATGAMLPGAMGIVLLGMVVRPVTGRAPTGTAIVRSEMVAGGPPGVVTVTTRVVLLVVTVRA
ncbi:hypothetical protein, partial [Curtobacterium sp. MMLR14_014]|uniref:hypothetical protein n=1 Tax=Curtobacterium sp. MMLR14_014 TaxID=1898744 RepID=UPI001C31B986